MKTASLLNGAYILSDENLTLQNLVSINRGGTLLSDSFLCSKKTYLHLGLILDRELDIDVLKCSQIDNILKYS